MLAGLRFGVRIVTLGLVIGALGCDDSSLRGDPDGGLDPMSDGSLDPDECTLGTHECAANATCSDIPDGFTCVCNTGYLGDGTTCVDIDECLVDNGGCSVSPMVTCTNTEGASSCGACPSGYTGDGVTCTDTNGCAGTPCAAGVTCSDVPAPGSGFTCAACPAGTTGDGVVCTNIDACSPNPCFGGGTCTDQAPPSSGFTCAPCPAGTTGDGVTCADIDGCAGNPCMLGQTCNDVPAPGTGFTCTSCPAGTTGTPPACTDINGCAGNPCFTGVVCTDVPAPGTGFTCGACPAGTTGDGITCTDINGCAGNPCFTGVVCTDVPAPGTGFTCGTCPTGTTGNGIACTNINACTAMPCFTGVACTDLPPPSLGRTCAACPSGYSGNGATCTDVDGCAGNPCAAGVSCTDVVAPGTGFTCGACPPGTTGDGVTCAPAPMTTVSFATPASATWEGTGMFPISVTLAAAASSVVTVTYRASGGTATGGGVDYTLATGMLSFAVGETSKSVLVSVVNDATSESRETVVVALETPSGASLGGIVNHTLTVSDDDSRTWPGANAVATVDPSGSFGGDLSGLIYVPAAGATAAHMYAVENGNGVLYRLQQTAGVWAPATSQGYTNGKTLRYPGGAGVPDAESVTMGDFGAPSVYVAAERRDGGASRNSILQYDVSPSTTSLTALLEWNLTSILPSTGSNAGAEAVTFVPDGFLVASGFYDERTSALYDPATYGDHGGGLFFVGLEATGGIYAVALDHSTGTALRVATMTSGFAGIMGLEFDREVGYLWASCDNNCNGDLSVLRVESNPLSPNFGRFVIQRRFSRPSTMPNINNEGIAIAPESECTAGRKPFYWTDDSDSSGFSVRRDSIPCGDFL